MKLLMIFCNKFSFEPGIKTLDQFETVKSGKSYNNILAGFIQAEKEDEADPAGVEKKLIKELYIYRLNTKEPGIISTSNESFKAALGKYLNTFPFC